MFSSTTRFSPTKTTKKTVRPPSAPRKTLRNTNLVTQSYYNIGSQLAQNDQTKLYKLFSLMDSSRKGELYPDSLRKALGSAGIGLDPVFIDVCVRDYAHEQGGNAAKVKYNDFVKKCEKIYEQKTTQIDQEQTRSESAKRRPVSSQHNTSHDRRDGSMTERSSSSRTSNRGIEQGHNKNDGSLTERSGRSSNTQTPRTSRTSHQTPTSSRTRQTTTTSSTSTTSKVPSLKPFKEESPSTERSLTSRSVSSVNKNHSGQRTLGKPAHLPDDLKKRILRDTTAKRLGIALNSMDTARDGRIDLTSFEHALTSCGVHLKKDELNRIQNSITPHTQKSESQSKETPSKSAPSDTHADSAAKPPLPPTPQRQRSQSARIHKMNEETTEDLTPRFHRRTVDTIHQMEDAAAAKDQKQREENRQEIDYLAFLSSLSTTVSKSISDALTSPRAYFRESLSDPSALLSPRNLHPVQRQSVDNKKTQLQPLPHSIERRMALYQKNVSVDVVTHSDHKYDRDDRTNFLSPRAQPSHGDIIAHEGSELVDFQRKNEGVRIVEQTQARVDHIDSLFKGTMEPPKPEKKASPISTKYSSSDILNQKPPKSQDGCALVSWDGQTVLRPRSAPRQSLSQVSTISFTASPDLEPSQPKRALSASRVRANESNRGEMMRDEVLLNEKSVTMHRTKRHYQEPSVMKDYIKGGLPVRSRFAKDVEGSPSDGVQAS